MNKFKEKIGDILNKIKGNKRILYLSFLLYLISLCLVLNITFSLYTGNKNVGGANIIVGDLKYKMFINEQNNIDAVVGEKTYNTSVIGDRILKILPGKKEYFSIQLSSLNESDTKYEVLYKVCTDVNCNAFVNDVSILSKIKVNKGTSNTYGYLNKNEETNIIISTKNETSEIYYILVELNAGYGHNNLELVGQITGSGSSNIRTDIKDLEISTTVAYIDGTTGSEFPDSDDFGTTVFCHHPGEDQASGTGELTYVYYDDNTTINQKGKWVLNVTGIESGGTICEVTFTEGLAPESFATDSWATIKKNIGSSKYLVGDTKCVPISGYTRTNTTVEKECGADEFRVRIVNKSTPSECLNDDFSQTACGFVVAIDNTLDDNYTGKLGKNGWSDSDIRTGLNDTVFNKLPDALKSAIIDTRVISSGINNTLIETIDKIYIPSLVEIEGESAESAKDSSESKTRKFDYDVGHIKYYKNADKINTNRYHLRSCYMNGANFVCYDYSAVWNGSSYNWGKVAGIVSARVSPVFRIGS